MTKEGIMSHLPKQSERIYKAKFKGTIDFSKITKELNHRIQSAIGKNDSIVYIALSDADDILALLLNMRKQIEESKSCKHCANDCHCSPDADYDSPEYKMFSECHGSMKDNWKWKGVEIYTT